MMYSAKLFTLPFRFASWASVVARWSLGDCGSAAGVASAIFLAMSTLGFCAIPAVARQSKHAVKKMRFFIFFGSAEMRSGTFIAPNCYMFQALKYEQGQGAQSGGKGSALCASTVTRALFELKVC